VSLSAATAVIGAGTMGTALMSGWIKSGLLRPENIVAVDVDPQRRRVVQEQLGVTVTDSLAEAIPGAEIVVIAVKPYTVGALLPELKKVLPAGSLVISIAAGIPLSKLETGLGEDAAVIRAMPNTPCTIMEAATGLSAGKKVTVAQKETALRLFRAVGIAHLVPETLLDAVTGLSGSGPAYVFLFIEGLISGGIQAGLPAAVARDLAAQTVLGAARLVLAAEGKHVAQLRDEVTTPAGTTAAGLLALEEQAFRAALTKAVLSASARAKELKNQFV